jgi:HEAT repeat protein
MSDQDNKIPGIGTPKQMESSNDFGRLLQELRDFHDEIRKKAAGRLGRLGNPSAVDPLIGRLTNDKSPMVRVVAVRALYNIGDDRAWDSIRNSLQYDKSAEVRRTAAEILGEVGDKQFAHDLEKVLEDEKQVREQAAISIGKLKNPEIIEVLIRGLRSVNSGEGNIDFEFAHIQALIQMGPMVVNAVIASAKIVPEDYCGYESRNGEYILLEHKYVSRQSRRCYYEKFYLDRIAIISNVGQGSIDSIAQFFSSNASIPERIVATKALTIMSSPSSTQILCSIATNDPASEIRWLSLESLAKRKENSLSDIFISVLQNDKDWILRRKAAELLGKRKEKTGLSILSKTALQDEKLEVRVESVNSIELLGNIDAIATLCKVALKDTSKLVRNRAISVLGSFKNTRAIPTLGMIVLDDPAEKKRIEAAKALGKIGSNAAVNYLLSGLGSDGDASVRISCAEAIGHIGGSRAIEHLKIVAESDPSKKVIRAATTALEAISKRIIEE